VAQVSNTGSLRSFGLRTANATVPIRPDQKIRSRAPLRLGLAGGGTDVSPYSEDYGGAILNTTIDRYAFTFIETSADGRLRFIASDLGIEECFPLDMDAIAGARLQLHAAVYRRMINEFGGGRPIAITVKTSVDAPPGSGLGSSSALVVAMVEAFRALLDLPLGPYEIARLAFLIERIDLGLAGGKQDHYAAAFGGINYIEFMAGDRVIVNPLRVNRYALNELEASLVTCFSGVSRRSDEIINQQRHGMNAKRERTLEGLHRLKQDALEMKIAFLHGDIVQMAEILDRSWIAKKETADGITTAEIELLHKKALEAGALAGKVSGAGGGGFIMFLVPAEHRVQIIDILIQSGGQAEGAHLTANGAESWVIPSRLL
jgi:D-glycero-alpha-D-manno-heptose-7-phosphate kinase